MRRALILATLALAASSAFAGDGDEYDYRSNGDCPPPPILKLTHGITGWQGWAVWQCRPQPADRAKRRYFDVYYAFIDASKISSLLPFEPMRQAYEAGNTWGAQDLAKKLIDTPYTDPLFAESKKAAWAAIGPKLIPTNVTYSDGKACACDVKAQTVGGILQCPRAFDLAGPLVACHGL